MTSVAHARPEGGGGAHDAHHAPMSFWRKYIFSTDHKIIGIQFLFVSLFFLLVGGLLAMQMRWQLGFPGKPMPGGGVLPETMAPGGVILPEYYIQLVTMHGTFMVFFAIMPLLVGVFANFLIPLKIGTHDMAFPRINMASFWAAFLAGTVMFLSFFVPNGAARAGWTNYVPLSVWALFVTAILGLLALPVLSGAAIMLLFDQTLGTHFFDPSAGGQVLLWQHLFWFFGHPEFFFFNDPATTEIYTLSLHDALPI